MGKKNKIRKRVLILGSVLLGIGIASIGLYRIGSRQVTEALIGNLLEKEITDMIEYVDGEDIVIKDRESLESLGIQLPTIAPISSPEEEKVLHSPQEEIPTIKPEENTTSTGSTASGPSSNSNKVPIKVNKQELEEAISQKVESITESIPMSDQTKMANLILRHVSKADINYLASLAADGLSASDLAIAKKIAMNSFPPEVLEQVVSYYRRYAYLI